MSLADIARDLQSEALLRSDAGHTTVAKELGVSEQAVRRWRKKHGREWPTQWEKDFWRQAPQQTVDNTLETLKAKLRQAARNDPPEWHPPGELGDMFEGPGDDACHPDCYEENEADQVIAVNDREQLHQRLDELLDQATLGTVKSMRVASWDGMVKNSDGEPEIVRQYGIRLESGKITPSWPVIQQARPVQVTVSGMKPRPKISLRDKLAVILPDPQIGYRFYPDTGEYDPFHDEKAIDVALQIIADINPDVVICLGDYLDLAAFSKYEQEAAFAHTTQKAIDYGYALLAKIRALSADADIIILEGNHDRRLEKMVTRNAMEAFGLRCAGDLEGWPVLSLPHLLRLSELGVEYVGGYPAGSYWVNDRLKCIHGSIVRSTGSTAKAVVDAERVSVIFGHVHRIETQYKTVDVREGGRTRLAHTPGCLCRIDGAVPSFKGSTDLSGRPVPHYEDWQQGLSVISFGEGDSPFSLEPVFINTLEGYRAICGGNLYEPEVDGGVILT